MQKNIEFIFQLHKTSLPIFSHKKYNKKFDTSFYTKTNKKLRTLFLHHNSFFNRSNILTFQLAVPFTFDPIRIHLATRFSSPFNQLATVPSPNFLACSYAYSRHSNCSRQLRSFTRRTHSLAGSYFEAKNGGRKLVLVFWVCIV